jgi:hypothetical protein
VRNKSLSRQQHSNSNSKTTTIRIKGYSQQLIKKHNIYLEKNQKRALQELEWDSKTSSMWHITFIRKRIITNNFIPKQDFYRRKPIIIKKK